MTIALKYIYFYLHMCELHVIFAIHLIDFHFDIQVTLFFVFAFCLISTPHSMPNCVHFV